MTEPSRPDFLGRVYKSFSSIRLAIVLIILLGLLSLLAIFLEEYFPSNFMNWEKMYSQKMGLIKFELLKFLGVFDPYHSFWYQLLLALLVINVCVCTWKRTPGILKTVFKSTFRETDDAIKQLKNSTTIKSKLAPTVALTKIQHVLTARKFNVQLNQTASFPQIFASRGGFSRLGYLLFHFGLVAVLIGGLLISSLGYTEYLWGTKGSILTPRDADFSVRVDDFTIETNPRGQVKDYLATLTVLDNEQEIFQKVVEVNFPLRYKGYTFYQSSYRALPNDIKNIQLQLNQTQPVEKDTVVSLHFDDKLTLPNFDCSISVLDFIPDFKISGDSIYTASMEPRNPAIQILVEPTDQMPYAQWLFLKFPQFHRKQAGHITFQFLNYEQELFTGLQVSKKPGSFMVWIGIIGMTLGLILSFYIFHRRIWVVIEETGEGQSKIALGGNINKNQESFKTEFKELAEQIRNAL